MTTAPEAVYWTNIPLVTTLQSLHWEDFRSSKRIRYFWYSFGGMALYQILPAYIMPWLNSVSIPCLASQKATGSKAAILTNLFGGSLSNEGLGILNFSYVIRLWAHTWLIIQFRLAVHHFDRYLAASWLSCELPSCQWTYMSF